MDYEYLQNVMGSPYVNEGAFDRLKAKGAQAMGALGAVAGYKVQNPTETRLRSLWEGFMGSLKRVMKDWQNQISPMLGADVQMDENGHAIKLALDNLASTLSTSGQAIGQFNQDYNVPSPRTPREHPETYGSSADASKLKNLTKEGLWDAAKRDMGLNSALASNNPSKILDSYKNYVLSLFQNFMKDAVKSTQMTAPQIYAMLAKLQPQKSGWQAAGNMQKVVTQLQNLQKTPTSNPTPYSGPKPPVLPKTSATATPQAGSAAPPPIPKTAQKTATQAGAASAPVGEGFAIPSADMPYVILTAMKIIVDATKSDYDHAMGLFGTKSPDNGAMSGYPQMATQWGGGPSLTSSLQEIHAEPKPKGGAESPDDTSPEAVAKKAEDDKWKYMEFPGEFLYNFHSRYSKYPGQPFSIPVTPVNVSPEIKEIPGASVEVWWQNEGGANKIYVTEIKDGKKSKPTLIMNFYDNHLNAKGGALTPGDSNEFSIDKLVQAANPYGPSKLSGATPEVQAELKNLQNDVFRALAATVQRKRMEFVSKGWDEKKKADAAAAKAEAEMPSSQIDDKGGLTYIDSESQQQIYVPQAELKKLLKGPLQEAQHWRDRLTALGYFEKFPDMPPPATTTQVWKDTNAALMTLGYTKNKANALMAEAWIFIKEKMPDASVWPEDANITPDKFVQISLKKKPTDKPEAPKPPQTAPGASPGHAGAISAPVTAPVSGGASKPVTAPVSAPVAGGASAPVTTTVDKPVSNGDKQAAASPKAQYGTVKLTGDELEWEHPKTHEVHHVSADQVMAFAKKQPKFVAALKANPDLYAKFKAQHDDGNKKPEGEAPKKVQERIDYINPFTRENFLL